MGLFRRLGRVTTGALRTRIRTLMGRESSVDPDIEAELNQPVSRPAPRKAPDDAPAAVPESAPSAEPADTVQVTDGPTGRRSL